LRAHVRNVEARSTRVKRRFNDRRILALKPSEFRWRLTVALRSGPGQPAVFNSKDRLRGLQVAPQVTPAPRSPGLYKLFTNEVKCAVAAEHYQTAISTFGLS